VFLIDYRDHPTADPNIHDPYGAERRPDLHLRRLNDGSEDRVVKVM
jgi:hypothetical protein